jgi:ribosome biogenesis GTPase
MAAESGARPIVLLNKSDLAAELSLDLNAVVASTQLLSPAVTIIPISALSDHGLDAIPAQLAPGQTAALIGSSGVGKSTILNRLLGDNRQATTAVRPSDSRGRHTTTTRQLFVMPGGWLLMDLPGLREIQLWAEANQPSGALQDTFDDIRQLAQLCRFRDCTHRAEPGCAVTAAAIEPARLVNYLKMQRELTQLDRKTDSRPTRETKSKASTARKSPRPHPDDD